MLAEFERKVDKDDPAQMEVTPTRQSLYIVTIMPLRIGRHFYSLNVYFCVWWWWWFGTGFEGDEGAHKAFASGPGNMGEALNLSQLEQLRRIV